MKLRGMAALALTAATLALGGCGMDVGKQLVGNEQLRGQVMDALASHRELAMQAIDRFMASDSLRGMIVDHMLTNDSVAKQVLLRIATNANAFDIVLGAALRDSAMHTHYLTLVKGMEMASPHRK